MVTKAADDCFAGAAPSVTLAEALRRLREGVKPAAGVETVSLAEACGRVLAAPVVAGFDVPPHDNSAVDGYAVFFDDLAAEGETMLPVGGRAAAGMPLGRPGRRGEAIRIFTGAVMPEGPDMVVMQEDCAEEGGRVRLPSGVARGANLRRAGEDIAAGAEILGRGRILKAPDIGLAASVGATGLTVFKRLRVALFSTGDEVREPGAPLPPGAVYDANRYAVLGLLRGLGCSVRDFGILPDRFETIRDTLAEAAPDHDLLISSGGMSMGEEDHMKAAVEAQGRLHFWRLAIKPGRPVALGQVERGRVLGSRAGAAPFLGLPGNPVAAVVTFLLLARPLILLLSGAEAPDPPLYRLPAATAFRKKKGRREFQRAILERDGEGRLVLRRHEREGSGMLSSVTGSDGLVVLAEESMGAAAGEFVDFLPFAEVTGL